MSPRVNLGSPQVEPREARLGSITGYAGSAEELVRRSHGKCLKERRRSFSQCLGCSTSNAACTVILIQDAAVISHGPVGCSTCFHEFAFTYRVNGVHRGVEEPTQRRIFTTNLDEKDTVFGGARKLAEAIREVHRRTGAKAVFVLTTCASGIIGDDPYATVESLSHASEAVATVQICATLGSYLGAALEQAYGVPEIRSAAPYGIGQTERWWREFGRLTGKQLEVEALLKEERAEWLPRIDELRQKLSGKTAFVAAGASHGHALIAVLRELGLEVRGAAVFHHDPLYDNGAPTADALCGAVRDYGDVPRYQVCNKQEFELVNILNRERPDVFLARHGGMTSWGARFGIPTVLVGDEHFGMNYRGLVNYGARILDALENDEFVTNLARHASVPYTRWWLEQAPDAFLEGES